jgi:hypothetical protein
MDSEVPGIRSLLSRRSFLELGAMATAALGINQSTAATHTDPKTVLGLRFTAANPRIGFIGTGGRGTSLLEDFLAADAQVNAICDIVVEKAEHARSLVEKAGQKAPSLYTKGDYAYEQLAARDDLDLVVIATPWDWHTRMAVFVMEHGKHAAVEVPAAGTLEDCWKLVDTSEKTQRHCIMLENCCYGYNETLILNMVRAGRFGDPLFGEAAYIHDLREELFSTKGEGLWRRTAHTQRDGNLYPTHGLGPVANYMGVNRGDRFLYMVSMSTPQRGLDEYRKSHLQPSDPRMAEKYVTGDLNTSLIKTANGLTITLKHDVANPHPYDRINVIGGTKGVFADYPPRIYLEGQKGSEEWSTIDSFKDEYENLLWKKEGEIARKLGGHGGMDFIMCYRLLQCMREGLTPDMDVYDAAAWSAPGPLSRLSVSDGSAPVKFPDFTRGLWKKRTGSSVGMS